MIRYALKCDDDHGFESWFQSADAFDTLKAAGHLACPVCGSAAVDKAMMMPRVRPARSKAVAVPEPAPKPEAPKPDAAVSKQEMMIAELRKKVEENSTWVGKDFATEARAIHDGDAPERPIWGEAKFDDAKALLEEGIPVAPLPFGPKSKAN